MTTHAQPIQVLVPGVSPFVGDAPEDRHAERVVREQHGRGDQDRPASDRALGRKKQRIG
jgi:hypothetical protein